MTTAAERPPLARRRSTRAPSRRRGSAQGRATSRSAGRGLCIGRDGGDAVTGEYAAPFPFTGGRIVKVVFDVGDDACIDRERHLAAGLARD